MNFILKISPAFLKELDRRLRNRYPWIWATRIHINVFWGLVFFAIFSMIGLLYWVDQRDLISSFELELFFVLLHIPASIWALFSLYHLALFNEEKNFGMVFFGKELIIFFIYLVTFTIPLVIPYSTTLVINQKIGNLVTDQELNNDYSDYLYGKIYFPDEQYSYEFYPSDTDYVYRMTKYDPEKYYRSEYYDESGSQTNDSIQKLIEQQETNDAWWDQLRDSVYQHDGVFAYKRPFLYRRKVGVTRLNHKWGEIKKDKVDYAQLDDFIFQRNLDRDETIALQKIKKFIPLVYKYSSLNTAITEDVILQDYRKHNYREGFAQRFISLELGKARTNMKIIAGAKSYDSFMYEWYTMLGYGIFIFMLSVVFSIFKNVHWKQFLLSFPVMAALITIFSVIGLLIGDEDIILTLLALLLIAVIVVSMNGFRIGRFQVTVHQATIILNVVSVFIPIFILFYFSEVHDLFHWSYFDQYLVPVLDREGLPVIENGVVKMVYNTEYSEVKERIAFLTFLSGFGLYIIFWHWYLKKLYLRIWALPKQK